MCPQLAVAIALAPACSCSRTAQLQLNRYSCHSSMASDAQNLYHPVFMHGLKNECKIWIVAMDVTNSVSTQEHGCLLISCL